MPQKNPNMNDASSDEDTEDDDERVFSVGASRKKRAVAETTRAEAPFDATGCTRTALGLREMEGEGRLLENVRN